MIGFRDAFRALRASPIVTFVAVLSLALGIGANTAMFSILDALVLRDLPVRHASRLAMLFDDVNGASFWSHPIWESIEARSTMFDGAFAFSGWRFNLTEAGEVDAADGLWVSGGMFEVLGVDAALGRTLRSADDQAGLGPDGAVAVISHGFWQRRFGGDPSVLGKRIRLDGTAFTIVGVTERSFFGPEIGRTFDVAVPLATEPLVRKERSALGSRGSWWLQVMVRLAANQTAEQATSAFRAVQPQIADETRPLNARAADQEGHLAAPLTIRRGATVSGIRDQYDGPLLALSAVVGLTLLIACGNIANLMLARATARRHEFSVRSALGASAARLGRQLLAESAMLAVAGAVLGVVVAVAGSRFLVNQLSSTTNTVFNRVHLDTDIDWRMLAFTGLVAVLTTLLFGVAPALRNARVAPIDAMKEQGRGTSSGREGRLAGSLVMLQVALSLVLLVGAGLFIRTFSALANRPLGFDQQQLMVVDIGTDRAGVDAAGRVAMFDGVLDATRALPGVSVAGLAAITPVSGNNSSRYMAFPGRPELPERERRVWVNLISPRWLSAMGTRVISGRDFDDRDRPGAMRTVIVNETFVRKFYGSANPIGQVITEAPSPTANTAPIEIVGVVEDAVYRSLREPVPAAMYWPILQQTWPGRVGLMVRYSSGTFAALRLGVTEAVTRVNPNLTTTARPYRDIVDASLVRERLLARLSGFFGLLALLLAALGLYGVTAYSVTRRRTELGIRMALGSSPRGVMQFIVGRVSVLVGAGLLVGGVVSWWLSRFIEGMLFSLPAHDLPTMLGAAALLASVAVVAAWSPARRAARIDPASVLRDG
jgi:putative ABC transport system permease protein